MLIVMVAEEVVNLPPLPPPRLHPAALPHQTTVVADPTEGRDTLVKNCAELTTTSAMLMKTLRFAERTLLLLPLLLLPPLHLILLPPALLLLLLAIIREADSILQAVVPVMEKTLKILRMKKLARLVSVSVLDVTTDAVLLEDVRILPAAAPVPSSLFLLPMIC